MAGEKRDEIEIDGEDDLLAWLDRNHRRSESVWLVLRKKSVPDRYLDRQTLLRALLRYGWIDSLPRRKDDRRSLLLISPRKPGSAWSAINKRVVERLEAEGLMHPAGAAVVRAARDDGSWTFLDDVDKGIVPDDLADALGNVPQARANFDAFPFSARRGILEWIKQARRPKTRARRIAETARLAAEDKRVLDWRAKQAARR